MVVDISERETELPEEIIGKLIRIAVEDKEVISLGPGEPDFKAPKPLVDYAKKVIGECSHYSPPGGRMDLKEAIVKKLWKDNKIKANPENVVVCCGSQEALLVSLGCTVDVSEQVIIPNPSFLAYLPTAELFNAAPKLVELKEEDNWEINPDEVKKQIDPKKTKVLIINTPANPTGNVLSKGVLEELADLAVEYDFYIFSDEAYEKIIYEGKHHSIGSFNGMEDRVVTLQTFSKSYAMCGYRLGYAVAPPKLAEAMTKMHLYTSLTAPTISQVVGVKALSLPKKYIESMVNTYNKRRKFIVEGLNDLGLYTKVPNGAFYAFSNIKEFSGNSRKFAMDLLTKGKVAAVPGVEFGTAGEGFLRFSYATDLKLIEKALERIKHFLKKI